MMYLLAVAITSAGATSPPMLPIEVQKPVMDQPNGVRIESFQLEIDQKDFNCSAGELVTGNRAPYAYSPMEGRFDGELQFYPARCSTSF